MIKNGEQILLALARHYAAPEHQDKTRDIECDAVLFPSARRLENEGAIEITEQSDGQTFSAALVTPKHLVSKA